MRLLYHNDTGGVSITNDLPEVELCAYKYAILSHTWASNNEEEVDHDDILNGNGTDKPGIGSQKIRFCARQARQDGLEYFWVDTCCINKKHDGELPKALISMFRWYEKAEKCYVFLSDVEGPSLTSGDEQARKSCSEKFRSSRWFNRGWTLQELLAPQSLEFFSNDGHNLGTKTGLGQLLNQITGIPIKALSGQSLQEFSIEERFRWQEGRQTKEEEDMVYSLFGIFNVSMPVLYGEGRNKAQIRLERELKTYPTLIRFSKIAGWLCPSDPWTNHWEALQQHEAQTGLWLLQSTQYQAWKNRSSRHLWVHGKSGCGKTVLCSTVVRDLQEFCQGNLEFGLALFYFTFSDTRKQTYDDMLRALVCQLGATKPAHSKLQEMYESTAGTTPITQGLEEILRLSTTNFTAVFIVLDALEEIPEVNGVHRYALARLQRLVQSVPKLKLFITSRHTPDLRTLLVDDLAFCELSIASTNVHADICKYMSAQFSADIRLRNFRPQLRALVEGKVRQSADGSFRWAHLLLECLKDLQFTTPSSVRHAIDCFPPGLNDVYAQTLIDIRPDARKTAYTLLRWIAYAQAPPSLEELVETLIINLEEGTVDIDDRGDFWGILGLLSGLITIIETNDTIKDDINATGDRMPSCSLIGMQRKIRLSHFTVLEYLESPHVLSSTAKYFHLESLPSHHFIARSCLTYITCYSHNSSKTSTEQDLEAFPLLEYAARSWFKHSALHQQADVASEMTFLESPSVVRDWLLIHAPDAMERGMFRNMTYPIASGLYYASYTGLRTVTELCLNKDADVNAQGGMEAYALIAASLKGHVEIVKMLLDREADIHAWGGSHGQALHAASSGGHIEVVKLLLNEGAEINARQNLKHTALHAASFGGHIETVALLLSRGSDPAAQGDEPALSAASSKGHVEIVKMLLDRGADIHARGGSHGQALHAASFEGHMEAVRLLLDKDAKVNELAGENGYALQAASMNGHSEIVELLLERGADVNAKEGFWCSALEAAFVNGHVGTARLLLSKGARKNPQLSRSNFVMKTALAEWSDDLVKLFVELLTLNTEGGAVETRRNVEKKIRDLLREFPPPSLDESSLPQDDVVERVMLRGKKRIARISAAFKESQEQLSTSSAEPNEEENAARDRRKDVPPRI